MEDAMTQSTISSRAEKIRIGQAHMPLSFLKAGEVAQVAKVRDKGEIRHHLETLGFVEGAQIIVVSEQGGNLIVEIKGARVAINKQVAAKIITK